MRRHFHSARDFILPIIDFFYPPFRRLMSRQTFRYATAGAVNTVLGLFAYYVGYKFIFAEREFDFGFYAFKAHIAALILSFCVAVPVGFFLSKYVVFSDSTMKGRIQLFRYLMICLFNLGLNYIVLKILVERFHIYPVFAQIITISLVVAFSYLAQRNYSFKADPPGEDVKE